jgi:hypothetical protein
VLCKVDSSTSSKCSFQSFGVIEHPPVQNLSTHTQLANLPSLDVKVSLTHVHLHKT